MVAMMMMIMFTILYIVMKCCKMDPSVILNEYSSGLKLLLLLLLFTVHAVFSLNGVTLNKESINK